MGEVLSNGAIHRKPTKFTKEVNMQKHHQLGLGKLEIGQSEDRPLDSQNFTGGSKLRLLLSCKDTLSF